MSKDILFTSIEKENFSNYKGTIIDGSLSTKVLTPWWNFVVKFVPSNVAPNVLSLGGLLCVLHAFYLCYLHFGTHPQTVTILSIILIFVYQTLDAIDGKHALNTRNQSTLGELFDHACDNIGAVFQVLTLCYVMKIENLDVQWYLSQMTILLFLREHLIAFRTNTLRFQLLTGPGEAIFLVMTFMALNLFIGFGWLHSIIHTHVLPNLAVFIDLPHDDTQLVLLLTKTLFWLVLMLVLFHTLTLPSQNRATRNGILISLLYFLLPPLLFGPKELTAFRIVCDGLFLSLVTTDLIASKMAKRDLHPFVVIFAMIAMFSDFATLVAVFIYHVTLFYELSDYMHLPIFTMNINVYVDGVYDLCHVGHYNAFKNAAKLGTRLYVGVLSDESVSKYKRAPVMTLKERVEIVSVQKYVYQVIPDCPFPGITEEFLKKYNIHIVAHSIEYDSPDDIYYKIPRQLGITRVLPRTEGISTSDLIKRIRKRDDLEVNKQIEEKHDKEKKEKTSN